MLQLQSAEVSRTVTKSFEWSCTISECWWQRRDPQSRELKSVHFTCNSIVHCLRKLQYTWSGDYCEHVRPAQLPVLTWGSSFVPPRTTSTIRSPPGPRRIQQPSDIDQVYSLIHTKTKSNISPSTLAVESSARTNSGSIKNNCMWKNINKKVSIYLVKIKRNKINNEIV